MRLPVCSLHNGPRQYNTHGVSMKAIFDLFSTDYGLFSIAVIIGVILMGFWFYRFFAKKMEESEREAKRLES
jgi:cytochrome c biogenesis protein CcdA